MSLETVVGADEDMASVTVNLDMAWSLIEDIMITKKLMHAVVCLMQ